MVFSSATQALLRKAGWYSGRSQSTLDYQFALSAQGYPWFAQVEAFLLEFGGLELSFLRQGSPDAFHFDARKAVCAVDSSWSLQEYAKRLEQTPLCVIGQAYQNHLLLLMDPLGNVYGGYDEYMCLIAHNGPAAIEALLHNQIIREIPELSN